ncbi:MAG: DNA polymerase III subunit delta' [Gemmataceae bacterium]|nr:DNA polymerase III subunit delta' [Gemmataceae bacterium]
MSWQRVRGHDNLVRSFAQAKRRGRLAHAYLFAGPTGVGKRLFAHELAKALLCEDPPETLRACEQCPGCIQVEAGSHPDFFATGRPEESPHIPIDSVRELCRVLSLKPVRGHGKVAIIDDADELQDPITGNAAANAFLKTLEEPSPGSVLLLIGTSPDRQMQTIVSRCQVVRFAPLSDAIVAELIRAQGVNDAALVERLVRLGAGSPGQAMALAEPALWEFRRTLLAALSQPRFDSVGLAKQWMEFAEEAGKESVAQRRRVSLVLRLLIDFLISALRTLAGETTRLREAEELRSMSDLGSRLGTDGLTDWLDRCLEADLQNERRVQLVLVVEALTHALGRQRVA